MNALSVKEKSNRAIIKAKVKANEWTDVGKITKLKMVLKEVEKEKKIIIMNDYEGYRELIDKIKKTMI